MEATLNRERFQKALSLVEHVTARSASLPILSNILIKSGQGQLTLSATNLEVGISVTVPAQSTAIDQVVLPARVLYDFIRTTRGDAVVLKKEKGSVVVSSGRSRTTMLAFDAAEYPIIPRIDSGTPRHVAAETLCSLLSGVAACAALSDSRPELAGILVKPEADSLCAAATDSFRLAQRRLKSEGPAAASFIVPRAGAAELIRVFGGLQGEVKVFVADNQISFIHPDVEMVSRLIDGKYPDYQKIIPERAVSKALVRGDELEEAVRVAALFSSNISDVRLACTGNNLTVSGKNANRGEAQADIEANLKGEPFEVAMNCHYLLDGLTMMGSGKVILEFTGKGSPFVLRPENNSDASVYLIMPLRA